MANFTILFYYFNNFTFQFFGKYFERHSILFSFQLEMIESF
ncbi:hypothetical protein HMPREF9093_00057 [Fusobacterium sp. oral taxon 370 str. F0437]|nr:hypothetical protein HMPREF9093_00057 [Fusobacterium sp. oral taxon 370 str. F0437]